MRGLYLAAGLSLNGFGGAGGIGKAVAELITTGETELDVWPYRAWRFGRAYRDPTSRPRRRARRIATTTGFATRSTSTSGGARGGSRRCTARMQDLGAVFGTKHGWERAD